MKLVKIQNIKKNIQKKNMKKVTLQEAECSSSFCNKYINNFIDYKNMDGKKSKKKISSN